MVLISAWAGPAKPSTAAVNPLAIMVANPNFFTLTPSFVLCSASFITSLADLTG